MKKENENLVSLNSKKYKKHKKEIINASVSGELSAYCIYPITGNPIRVHPDLVKRMREGETLSIEEILNKKFD
jgi:hypothetical protein